MARLNFVRTFCAASLWVLSSGGALLTTTASPAGAAVPILVTISDTGFSQREVKAQVGDVLTFQLDSTSTRNHTVTFDGGELEFDFSQHPENSWTLPPLKHPGRATFYDRHNMRRRDRAAFIGTLVVTEAPDPSPPSTTPSTATTVTTTAPSSTTTTLPPSTTTTAPATIRPMVIDPPPASTTTTARPGPPPSNNAPAPLADNKNKGKPKGNGKNKAASTETATTATSAPPDALPADVIFDLASLTPGPTTLFGTPVDPGSGDETALDAAALADLLDSEPVSDDGSRLTFYGLGALAFVFLVGSVWGWHHRSSRYFPA